MKEIPLHCKSYKIFVEEKVVLKELPTLKKLQFCHAKVCSLA